MLKTRSWLRTFSASIALVLSACGGAEFGDGGGGLGGGGGGVGAGLPAKLTVTPSQETAFADGTATVLISAVLTDINDVPVRGRTLGFTTNAGQLLADSATTNADGVAQVFLRAPVQQGTATVVVRESATGITGATSVEFQSGLVDTLVGELAPIKLAPRAVAAFTITALDASRNPVAGQTITFDTVPFGVGGTFTPVSVTTDDNGRATSAFQVGENTGVFTLRGRTAGGLETTAQLTVATQGGLLLSVTPSQPSIPADGQSTVVISAVLTDSNEVPRGGRTIEFTTNAGTFATGATPAPTRISATTDSNGRADVTLRSSTTRGIATVTARETGTDVTGATAVGFNNGSAAQLTTVLQFPQIATRATTRFTATVIDSNGNPVAGEAISFDVVSGGGTFAQTSVPTDSNGRAEGIYTASATAGTVTLRARTAGGLSSTAQLAVVQSDFLTVTATPLSVPADGNSVVQIVATLVDANSNPIPNRTVVFTTGLGSLSAASALTNDQGVARVTLRAPNSVGTTSVTASVSGGGVSGSVGVQFTAGPAAGVSVSVNPGTVAPGGSAVFTATVVDRNGNPVEGASVSFSIASGNTGGASFTATTATTNASGVASSTFIAGTATGTFTLSALAGGQSATAQINVAVGVTGITVLSSAPTLQSSAIATGEGLTISAQVRKEGNQVVPGVTVNFSATSGLLQLVNNGLTDASGTARATLTTGGDPTNRVITVTARNEGSTGTVTVAVVGTEVSLDGPRSIQSGVQNEYVATLTNSVGAPIPNRVVNLSTTAGTLSSATATTDANGKATFRLTVPVGPSATLTASALGATDSVDISVTDDSLVFVSPTDVPAVPTCAQPQAITSLGDIPLNTNRTIRVLWCRAGAPVGNRPVSFTTTRGAFGGSTSITVNTDPASGIASVTIQAQQAGVASVLAVGNDNSTDPVSTPFALINGEFVATVPASIDLQADPTVIGINQQSVIQATVRDADNNLVKNATVNFSLNDVTGGTLSAGSAVTNSQGRASVVYRASSTTSAQDGVRVTATVSGSPPSVNDTALLTVGAQSLRIVLGTGNEIRESADTTRYELPYTAIVTDAAGNPTPGAELSMTGFAEQYGKGFYTRVGNTWVPVYTAICDNEDLNENGVLDPGEDVNNNGILDPANPVSVPLRPSLDQNGVASFDITYPQDRGNWITSFRLSARARVSGTEATETARFQLPISAADATGEGSPPGQPSPFGQVARCDLTDEQVPLIEFDSSSRSATALEGGAPAVLRVNASRLFGEDITIPLELTGGNSSNPFVIPATVTITAGTLFVDFALVVPDNANNLPDSEVVITLGSPVSRNAIVGDSASSVVTIVDND
jgi:adhesin/invasin